MRLVGVLDVLSGQAVRAIAGRRAEYRPIQSRLCESADPRRIAAEFRAQFGISELYLADLDAILGRGQNTQLIAELVADGFRVAVDPGLRSARDADDVEKTGASILIAGLETIREPALLGPLVERLGPERVAFSIDLSGGIPLGQPAVWGMSNWSVDAPYRLIRSAVDVGVRRVVVLDLEAVGTGRGPVTLGLCRQIAVKWPEVRLWSGGGVRDEADVQSLIEAGVDRVLVASLLHTGGLVGDG